MVLFIIGDDKMLGTIVGVYEDMVLVKPSISLADINNIINFYVVMEDNGNYIVGEIEIGRAHV